MSLLCFLSVFKISSEDTRAEQCLLCWQQLALTVPLFIPVFIATALTLQNRKNTGTANCRSWAQAPEWMLLFVCKMGSLNFKYVYMLQRHSGGAFIQRLMAIYSKSVLLPVWVRSCTRDKSSLLTAPKECQKRSFKSDSVFSFLTALQKENLCIAEEVSLPLLCKVVKITQTEVEI